MAKVGLVLSGGMLKGAYQIGALKSISEYFSPSSLKSISGSSIGVWNAYSLLTGTLGKTEQLWTNLTLPKNGATKFLKTDFLDSVFKKIYIPDYKWSAPFYISLMNITHFKLEYVDVSEKQEKERQAFFKAAVSLPPFHSSITINKIKYIDGAVIDNIPVFPLLNQELDYIFCIYFDQRRFIFENSSFNQKIIPLCFGQNLPICSSFYASSQERKQMIQIGYDKTSAFLQQVFKRGTEDIEYIYHKNHLLQKNYSSETMRITGDMLVDNMNVIAQKILKSR